MELLLKLVKSMRLYKYVMRALRRRLNKGPTRNFDEFFVHVKKLGFYPGTVIDVGAANGTPSLQDAFKNAYFIWFEPLTEFMDQLKALAEKYSGEAHNCALMATDKMGQIFKTNDLFGSSVMHTINDSEDDRIASIDINTLDSVISGRELPTPYLLKVDCQGGGQVVLGGKEVLKKCELVILEISFFKFWGVKHPEPLEILNYMDTQEFVIYDILGGLFRPLDGALGQVDFFFVKKDGLFRTLHKWSE